VAVYIKGQRPHFQKSSIASRHPANSKRLEYGTQSSFEQAAAKFGEIASWQPPDFGYWFPP
jgi:hypothetical protein